MRRSRCTVTSERELESELHNSCIGRFYSQTEQRTVEIALYGSGSKKLRVIERIEALDAQLQKFGFRDVEILEQGNIEIQRARSMEGAARCISKGTEVCLCEGVQIEIRQAITGVAVQVERRACVLADIEAIVIHAVRDAALQGIVIVALEGDGKACAGTCDAAQLPPLR